MRDGHRTNSNVVVQVKIPTHIIFEFISKLPSRIKANVMELVISFLFVKCETLTTLPLAETVQHRVVG